MNKVALVTGASRGIGAATAKLLASQGYAVCVNYKRQSNVADDVAAHIHAAGGKAITVKADVTIEAEVNKLFLEVEQRLGKVTHLVNNVGILYQQSSLANMSLERFNLVLTTNVSSCFLYCREALKSMNTGCAIVNVSSAAARLGRLMNILIMLLPREL